MKLDPVRASVDRRARRMLRQAAWEAEVIVPGRRPPRLADWSGPTTTLPPIIVGGTGRSGTSVTARILGHYPDYHLIPFEVKFISNDGGLTCLLAGKTTIAEFERLMLGKWFRRTQDRGLHQITDPETIRAAVRELNSGLKRDGNLAARRFTHRLLDPSALAAGKRGWIENTPNTIRAARRLTQILPDARLVHMVRDGRDVACSVTNRSWGPSDADEGLRWWANHLERSFEATAAVGEERILTLRMESLLSYDREATFCRMLEFLGLRDDPAVRTYFEEQATGQRAHIGRWRNEVPPEAQAAFLATYREASVGLAERWGYDPELADRPPVTAAS
jgi:hypothetical protein